jgi:ABC-type multidrug transport system fused ATPase/permease subunit
MDLTKIVDMSKNQYIVYLILGYIIISYVYNLMTSSTIEKFMFQSKDKLAFRVTNIIIMWIATIVIVLTFGDLLRKIIVNADSIPSFNILGVLYLIIFILGRVSTFVEPIKNAIEWLNSKHHIKNILIAVVLFIAFYPFIRTMVTVYNLSEKIQTEVKLIFNLISVRFIFNLIVACILSIFALILFWFMSKNIILPEKEHLYIYLENQFEKWYLIKFINKDVLLGDEYSEESCSKYMLVDRAKLKDIKVYIEKK